MSKLGAFVRLDFMTVKPYFSSKNMLVYTSLAVYFAIVSGNIGSSIGIGLMLATMNIGYPFALGEKNNMDALYTTIGADKKTVVMGRYIFSLLLNVGAVLFMAVFWYITSAIMNSLGDFEGILADTVGATLALSAVFVFVQSIQIPMFFKFGYARARFFTVFPLLMFSALVTSFIMNAQGNGLPDSVNLLVQDIMNNAWAIGAILITVLAVVVFISYKLSLAFYMKREF